MVQQCGHRGRGRKVLQTENNQWSEIMLTLQNPRQHTKCGSHQYRLSPAMTLRGSPGEAVSVALVTLEKMKARTTQEGGRHQLHVNLPFRCISSPGQSKKPAFEVFAAGFGVTRVTLVILVNTNELTSEHEEVLQGSPARSVLLANAESSFRTSRSCSTAEPAHRQESKHRAAIEVNSPTNCVDLNNGELHMESQLAIVSCI